jgi:hypothetical protein
MSNFGQISMQGANTPVPAQVSEMEQAMIRLRDRIEGLHQRIEATEIRFNSVLRNEPPKQDSISKDSGSQIPLVAEIHRMASAVEGAISRLVAFNERCGL